MRPSKDVKYMKSKNINKRTKSDDMANEILPVEVKKKRRIFDVFCRIVLDPRHFMYDIYVFRSKMKNKEQVFNIKYNEIK